jgi:hypothetical protein
MLARFSAGPSADAPLSTEPSTNFAFLAHHDPRLVALGTQAEEHFAADPTVCLFKLRQFGEVLAKRAAARVGLFMNPEEGQQQTIDRLWERDVIGATQRSLFHDLRRMGMVASNVAQSRAESTCPSHRYGGCDAWDVVWCWPPKRQPVPALLALPSTVLRPIVDRVRLTRLRSRWQGASLWNRPFLSSVPATRPDDTVLRGCRGDVAWFVRLRHLSLAFCVNLRSSWNVCHLKAIATLLPCKYRHRGVSQHRSDVAARSHGVAQGRLLVDCDCVGVRVFDSCSLLLALRASHLALHASRLALRAPPSPFALRTPRFSLARETHLADRQAVRAGPAYDHEARGARRREVRRAIRRCSDSRLSAGRRTRGGVERCSRHSPPPFWVPMRTLT